MKFLIDAQLPRRVATWFCDTGCDAIHTLDLPDANRTTDARITELAVRERRVVVTKDADFVDSYFLNGEPTKLLLVSTGNLSNSELETMLLPLIPTILLELQTNSFLELGSSGLIVRG